MQMFQIEQTSDKGLLKDPLTLAIFKKLASHLTLA
jgi:hypothetical protein